MAEKRGFDLAALLGSVPDLNSGAEQIELIPWDKLIPDDRNFYSLEGLEELADSIATVGLLDPIRVRRDGDVYVIISGHRRRAAIKLLIDSGEEQWAEGVPCIVERGEITAELAELKLIYANSATRKLSPAELSRQAARVEELLYALKAQGYSFPGRMQAHVAQAVGTTENKLKRLHAIRNNLDDRFLECFDRGQITEDAAYQLSKFDAEVQSRVAELSVDKHARTLPIAATLSEVWKDLKEHPDPPACKKWGGAPCPEALERLARNILRPYSWQCCSRGKCCLECQNGIGCYGGCTYKKEQAKAQRAQVAAEDKKRRDDAEQAKAELKERIQRRCAELVPLIDYAGLRDKETLTGNYNTPKVKDIRRWAAGDFGDDFFYSYSVVAPERSCDAVLMAERLGCSVLFAMDVKEPETAEAEPEKAAPAGAPEPAWQTGTPERRGRYFTTILIRDPNNGDSVSEHRAEWDGECWWLYQMKLREEFSVLSWWPLPEKYSNMEE